MSNSRSQGSEMVTTSETVVHQVHHLHQRFNWDCGVTCVLMLLNGDERRLALEHFDQICTEEGFGESTWTIDLCYLLKRFNIKHEMYTSYVGVNESHKKEKYYHNIIDIDRTRVCHRFNTASACGIRVTERAFSERQLATHVRLYGPAIVLIDNQRLAGGLGALWNEFRSCLPRSYCGHYVLVIGVSNGKFLLLDPGSAARPLRVRPRRLMAARAAPCTDGDVILVYP